jgi:hypothetical protein
MLSPEQDNRAVSECEVKVTLDATEADEPIRKHFRNVLIEPANKPRSIHVQGSFEEGSGR